jgi:hypothetical protein
MNKIDEALDILVSLELPDSQQNERTALCLLALLDLKPDSKWAKSRSRPLGITPIMDYIAEYYNKRYKPNSRETIRDESVTPMVLAGMLVRNLDDPYRPKNSSLNNYQVEESTLELIQTYGTSRWDKSLKTYLESRETLKKKYAKEREMVMVPIKTEDGVKFTISPGNHSLLIKAIIEEFAPRYAPGSDLLYVGDTGSKWNIVDEKGFAKLGLRFSQTTNMPDVILFYKEKGWLLLIESVTSNGPMNGQRHEELKKIFRDSKAPIVYVTAFPDRKVMTSFLSEIAWETEVWCADAPTHLIHFNGSRFLGPY